MKKHLAHAFDKLGFRRRRQLITLLNAEMAARAAEADARAELDASLHRHLRRVNQGLDPHEQLAFLVVASQAWSVDNDILVPTFKVKRNRIKALYSAQYEHCPRAQQAIPEDAVFSRVAADVLLPPTLLVLLC